MKTNEKEKPSRGIIVPVINKKNNFDLLRLILALTVCLAHLAIVTGSKDLRQFSAYFNSSLAVNGFFVVSGFLVFMSFNRSSSLKSYLEKRFRRIVPAYAAIVLLCALTLPFLSNIDTKDAMFSSGWLQYLISNIFFLNFLQPELPGVFAANPLHMVNAPLWTIKVEILFYLTVPLIALTTKKYRLTTVILVIYALSILYSHTMNSFYENSGKDIYLSLEKQLPGQLSLFLSGALLYLHLDFFQRYAWGFLVCAVPVFYFRHIPQLLPLYPIAMAVLVIFFAVSFFYLGNWGRYGDFSYGLYLIHFPVLQLLTASTLFKHHPWIGLALYLILIIFAAWISWHLIEKPLLRRTSHYRASES